MDQITVNDITIDVVRKDIKNLHLAVYPPTGRVRIAIPLKVKDESVRLFAISKLAWIKRHQRTYEKQDRQGRREFVTGESHYFNGKRYLLNVVYHVGKPEVILRHKKIDLFVNDRSTTVQRSNVLNAWYRQQLKRELPDLIDKWQRKMNVELMFYGIRHMKTKWGSCNIESKRIWLNLELAKKSSQCLEYIIVHELVHLLERYHNDRFVAYMNKYLPQWRSFKEELNRSPLSHSKWTY